MKRFLCLVLAAILMLALGAEAFADDVLFCRKCGKQIPSDSRFCSYCGEAVVSIATPSAESAPAEVSAAPVSAVTPAPIVTAAPAPVVVAQPVAADAKATAVPGPFHTTSAGGSVVRQVAVTKSPTSESVPYGGSCMFIAHAVNATSVTWYLASSDASLIIPASDGPAYVAGLSVSGVNSDTLYLSGIPAAMNGCLVQACFTGEGGPVYTDIARIWTYQPTASCVSQKKDDSIWSILAQWDPWWDPCPYYDPWWSNAEYYDPWWGYEPPNPPDVAHSYSVGYYSVAPESVKQDPPVKPAVVEHIAHESNPVPPPPPAGGKPGPAPASLALPTP